MRKNRELLQIPVAAGLAVKKKETKSQKKLNAAQRKQNLADAFRAEENIRGLTVLVIDDVYTTGSTVDAMAQVPEGSRRRTGVFYYAVRRTAVEKP